MPKKPEQERRRRGFGRVRFIANIEAIRSGVDAGYPLVAIYERHKGELDLSYQQFARYVAQFIRNEGNTATTTRSKSSAERQSGGQAPTPPAAEPAKPKSGAIRQFKHDPHSGPKKDDLV